MPTHRNWTVRSSLEDFRNGALPSLRRGRVIPFAFVGLAALAIGATEGHAQDAAAPAAAPVPPPPPPMSTVDRIASIKRDLATARAEKEPNPRALEAICTAWQPRRVFETEPNLKVELAICAARAAFLADRENVVGKRLEVAMALTAGDANTAVEVDLQARARLLRAEISKARYERFERCGTNIGLVRLRKYEAEEMRRLLDVTVSHYRAVLGIGAPAAELTAVASIARLYDDFYRKAALKRPTTYRGVDLPSPFTYLELRTDTTLGQSLAPSTSPWPREIRRLYDIAITQAKQLKKPALVTTLTAERDALANDSALEQEVATAPWKAELPAGIFRVLRGTYQKFDGTKFVVVKKKAALKELNRQVRVRPMGPTGAFALVALADAGQVRPVDVLEAIKSKAVLVRFAGFRAMEVAPVPEYKAPLLLAWTAANVDRKVVDGAPAPLFTTLQSAMFGENERVLLALRSLITRERDVALDITYTRALPFDERAWLIAELGDTRTRYRVIELVQTGDVRTQAIALYGTYLSNGERAIYMLRQYRNGLPGCVAKNTLGIHEERERRMAGVPIDSGGE